MKKTVAIILCLVLAVSAAACAGTAKVKEISGKLPENTEKAEVTEAPAEEEAETEPIADEEEAEAAAEAEESPAAAEAPNPMAALKSRADLEEAMDVTLYIPETAEETGWFLISGTVGEVDFTYSQMECRFRMSRVEKDFSGVYGDRDPVMKWDVDVLSGERIGLECNRVNGGLIAEWEEGGLTYSLYSPDTEDDDPFCKCAMVLAGWVDEWQEEPGEEAIEDPGEGGGNVERFKGNTGTADLDGDGCLETVTVEKGTGDDRSLGLVTVTSESGAEPAEMYIPICEDFEPVDFGYFADVDGDGLTEVFLNSPWWNDLSDTFIFTYDHGTLRFADENSDWRPEGKDEDEVRCASVCGCVEEIREDGTIVLSNHIDCVGTYTCTADHVLVKNEKEFTVSRQTLWFNASQPDDEDYYTDRCWMTTTRELPVEVEGETAYLYAGCRIKMLYTDAESVFAFVCEDGSEGILHVENREGIWCIEGESDFEWFESVPYAG